jgi:hypothetical protein
VPRSSAIRSRKAGASGRLFPEMALRAILNYIEINRGEGGARLCWRSQRTRNRAPYLFVEPTTLAIFRQIAEL